MNVIGEYFAGTLPWRILRPMVSQTRAAGDQSNAGSGQSFDQMRAASPLRNSP